jgi:hypothetical protein
MAHAGFFTYGEDRASEMSKRQHKLWLKVVSVVAVYCALLPAWGASAPPAVAQDGIERRLVARAEQITGDKFTASIRTPRGARVFARSEPRTDVLRAIDDGLAELFVIARRHGYRARMEYADYTVFIARADRTTDSNGNYSPDIAIAAGQYAGSRYDQGGFVYAAGMVFSFDPGSFIIAEHEKDWQRISNVVRYEGEHLVLYFNDRTLFDRTADHSRGGGHPILQ